MKNSWLIWFIVVGVVITVLVAFNYQDEQGAIPLSEIFPEEEDYPVNIEYEFVDDGSAREQKIVQKIPAAPQAVSPQPEIAKKAVETKVAVQETIQEAAPKVKVTQEELPLAKANYSIQVASFKTKERAQRKASELAQKELDAFVLSRDLAERGTWYRVYVGKFASKDEAGNYLTNVKKVATDSFIISLK